MRKWKCHKVVEAEQITDIRTGKSYGVDWALADGSVFKVEGPIYLRFYEGSGDRTPAIGDYLVKYEDGYMSWSPRLAFETGYAVLEPNALELGAAARKAGPEGEY